MLSGVHSWRLFFYVLFAFAMTLFILAFIFVEETSYDRKAALADFPVPSEPLAVQEPPSSGQEHATIDQTAHIIGVPKRKSFAQTLSLKGRVDPTVPFFATMLRSFTYILVPQTLWVITTFGINIGLVALVINYIFPIKIVAPPYNWSEVGYPSCFSKLMRLLDCQANSGLNAISAIIGYSLAVPFTTSSDRLAARLTRKNGGIREAEMRLGAMLPAMLVGPAGSIVYGFTAARNLHWIGYFAGSAMLYWSVYFYFSFTLAYAVDSYYANTSEMLIIMNVGKQAISFGFGLNVLTWVQQSGYAVVVGGIFAGVLLFNNLILLVFMIWGKPIRRLMSTTWLARLHRQSVREVMTH